MRKIEIRTSVGLQLNCPLNSKLIIRRMLVLCLLGVESSCNHHLAKPSRVLIISSCLMVNPFPKALFLTREDTFHSVLPTSPSGKVSTLSSLVKTFIILSLFPSRFKQFKKEEQEKEILETFHKVKINIPLLDTIK